MKNLSLILFLFVLHTGAMAGGPISFRGQASVWLNYSSEALYPAGAGGRYLPQLNLQHLAGRGTFDLEGSANLSAAGGWASADSAEGSGRIKAYRLWARYSTPQLEVRLGLQKINFGSATLLRPLMWFDRVDPRDPLQLTDGIWGLLGRYYFLNNATLWLWLIKPADDLKSWEIIKSNRHFPEWGGRIQYPVPGGEIALSGHFRTADARDLNEELSSEIHESRIGLDGRWDWIVGLALEGAWIHTSPAVGPLADHSFLTAGADYTLGIGNGLSMVMENLWYSSSAKGLQFAQASSFAGFSLSYPVTLFTRISAILYADWQNDTLYRFINWQNEHDHFALHLIAFWNPATSMLPGPESGGSVFAGKGGQLMLVYNH
jgi:hypothetical protein